MKDRLKAYREANPGTSNKDAMKAVSLSVQYNVCKTMTLWMPQVAAEWRDAPENPNRGQDPKAKTKRAPKAAKVVEKPAEDTATSEAEPTSDV